MLKKVLLLGAITLSFAIILPSVAMCIPFNVSGEIYYAEEIYEIEGTMDISEPVVSDHTPEIAFTYDITDFDLSFADLSFTGTSSSINSIYYDYEDTPFTCEFDLFHLASDDGAMNWYFLSAGAVFYDKNGVAYQDTGAPTDFYYLPYLIEAEGLYVENELFGNHAYVESLTIERAAPVPEPGSIILLSIGLFGASVIRRKKRALSL